MLFNSYEFFLFLPIVIGLYFICPAKLRTSLLLLASIVFFMSFKPIYIVVLIFLTVTSYLGAIWVEKLQIAEETVGVKKKRKAVLVVSILATVGLLLLFKYTNFLLDNLNGLGKMFHVEYSMKHFSLAAPVGISYITFQIISYLVDVYRGKIAAEKNFLHYSLYISFFPRVISGPIERADEFIPQIKECHTWKLWNANRVSHGVWLMIWGYFEKLVIADRLAIFVEEVFGHVNQYGTIELSLGTAFFFMQLYADFMGYMHIAQGMARIMGFRLTENFKAPYFAKSVHEYWARWHISLSNWLRDYLYIPLGGNRKGIVRKYINLMTVFLLSGLWHGANWTFLVWGGLQGAYEIGEDLLKPVVKHINYKLGTKTESFGYKLMQRIRTIVMLLISILFFKSASVAEAINCYKRIFTKWNPWVLFDGSLYTVGIDEKYAKVVFIAMLLFFLVDGLKYKFDMSIDEWLEKQCIWFRWGILGVLIMSIIVFGAYGPAYSAENFIYFQF